MNTAPSFPGRTRLALAALAGLGLGGCGESEPLCDNTIVREAVSPDGALKAILFERSCGVTTGFSSQVSILGVDETETDAGNAFIADTAGGAAPAAAWGGPDVALEWTSPEELTLTYPGRSRIIEAEELVRGVTVTHRTRD